ncbi:hypothetical protein B0T24DRAFT_597673 [Lasiosphaeria ovina]|uniref:CP-type G domain-containing protein n=1 Tax=Lasiosphaeria ovina TaxID=92902 RepID=A0AAE0N083_9PEZI|nr:hypothetical protein B0T24DRAFT_597673 [Lasiosphaeria ovina]
MVKAKSKTSLGLGNTLMNDRFGKGKGADRKKASSIVRTNHDTGEQYITNDRQEASWVKMRSVTEQGALDEFLATAELAGTDFTAEKMSNVKIIHTDQRNPYLLSSEEEKTVHNKQKEHKQKLTVPRRPQWDASTTPGELDRLERESFLLWRRGLAELQEIQDLLMTPFERNLEVWRQLWRVIERSDLVVQIVDARNPLMFRSEGLEAYVKDVDSKKQNLLLINKADMMTYKQRKVWANYLKDENIAYTFFSANMAKELLELEEAEGGLGGSQNGGEGTSVPRKAVAPVKGVSFAQGSEDESSSESEEDEEESGSDEDNDNDSEAEARKEEEEDEDTRILTVDELENVFLKFAPKDSDHKFQVGLVGYPNVGKSSTINALTGAKKVSVSATPGKTKHFQTIHLSDKVILCDCPGLVFPNFANTKAELVCNGVLPIDQLREFTGPASLVARRIPQSFLETVYTIKIRTRPLEEGGTGIPTAEELLSSYARHRGYITQGFGQPDQSRAARYILKDYVKGRLLYVEPPPDRDIDPKEFNRELYDMSHLPESRRAAWAAVMASEQAAHELAENRAAAAAAGGTDADGDDDLLADVVALPHSAKSKRLDRTFFKPGASTDAGRLKMPFQHKYTEQGATQPSGKHMSGRKMRQMIADEQGIDVKDVQLMTGKKHFKGGQTARAKRQANKVEED